MTAGSGDEGDAQLRLADVLEEASAGGDAALDAFFRWVEAAGLVPYAAQEEALLELMTGKHVILSTPTGSGKSLVALGLHLKAMSEGRRSFYTAPTKALVNEKFFALCDEFGAKNVGMLTGDATLNWAAPIICCTAEVLANMALAQGEGADAPFVVMDEFHYYADRDRGVAWQLPLLALPNTTFLLMSATLGNVAELRRWIEGHTGRPVANVHSDERPVPLDFSYRETPIHRTVEALLAEGRQPIYIVHFTQREAAEQAQGLTSANVADRETRTRISESIGRFRFDSPYGKDIARFLRHGIGIHHAGLLPKYRLLVEQLAQQGLLRVICGTDTLGVGVNIPIRTVLFTRLSKFDGERVGLLSIRDFKQISGRAGRKGFDDRGSVVCQAPEHVVENKRKQEKDARSPGRSKPAKRKAKPKGFVEWNAATFERLATQPAETLTSKFSIDHGFIIGCLQMDESRSGSRTGYGRVAELIELCHEGRFQKRKLRRHAAMLLRSLRYAGVVEALGATEERPATLHVAADLQEDFTLHHSLSLYLLEAVEALDETSETHTLDVLSLVESILENPRAILFQLVKQKKSDLMSRLKAEHVPYEERLERLDEVTWDKPNDDFIYMTFNAFALQHPWVGNENIRPKSIARDMYEGYSSFEDYVKRRGLARMEGVLLRYLGQVHGTLQHTLPDAAKTDEILDLIHYLRTLLIRVDSSLLDEWERRAAPASILDPGDVREAEIAAPSLADDPRAFRARVRSECHALVRALARGDHAVAAECVRPDPADPWPAERFEHELEAFFSEYETIRFDPPARQAHWTRLDEVEPRLWRFRQTLLDDREDAFWHLEGEIDLREEPAADEPLLRLRRIGE